MLNKSYHGVLLYQASLSHNYFIIIGVEKIVCYTKDFVK